ncbi:MAG: methyltransferase domain-containing protein [Candidatus Schekmanbacteria bacterium]|nr:methyltransferase domain-containing protein [Candidatus Schekmanbacteria bacterium]
MSKDYFDATSGCWDEMRATFYTERLRERAFQAAGVRAGALSADIGAGTGFITEGLVQRGLRVIAVDQSAAMLAEVRQKMADAVDSRQGDAELLPIDDGAVDFAFANMVLHHVSSPARAIQEMARILRPGGTLVVTDLDEHDDVALRDAHCDRWMGFKRGDMESWLLAAALTDIEIGCVDERCCESTAKLTMFVASARKRPAPSIPPGPIVALVYRIPPESRTEMVAFLRRAFPLYERPGGIRMGLFESADEPGLVLELVAYDSDEAYLRDQERVERDPKLREVLAEWKRLVNGPVEVRRMRPLAI